MQCNYARNLPESKLINKKQQQQKQQPKIQFDFVQNICKRKAIGNVKMWPSTESNEEMGKKA